MQCTPSVVSQFESPLVALKNLKVKKGLMMFVMFVPKLFCRERVRETKKGRDR